MVRKPVPAFQNPRGGSKTVLDSLTWGELMASAVDDPRFTANYDLTHYLLQFMQINTISNFSFSKYNFLLKRTCEQKDRSNSQSFLICLSKYRKIPEISPSKYKPPKPVTQKTLR